MIATARSNGLAPLWTRVQDLRLAVDDAQATRESWATRYSALKHAADLRAAMLRAFTTD